MIEDRLTLVEHLEELRNRIIKSLLFILILCGLLFNYISALIPALIKPVGKLVFIAPQEAFVTNIKMAFFGGLFLASPFVLYQIWCFISTGLKARERRYALIFGPFSFILFVLGIGFSFFLVVPVGMKFLLGFSSELVTPMISISNYISFIASLALAFGIIFQLPIISLFLTKLGLVTPMFLAGKRKQAVVLVFIAAALLTPPDVITQCLMAVPLIILYEIGIGFSKLAYRRAEKKEDRVVNVDA